MSSPSARFERIPVIVSFAEQVKMTETYGFAGSQGKTFLEGQRLVPLDAAGKVRPGETLFVFMHPASTLQLLPMPTALAEAGLHVLCAGSRYARNDSALIMEKVVYDLGQYIRHAKEELSYKRVVLAGWSGGGLLSLFYQAQAERADITRSASSAQPQDHRVGRNPARAIEAAQ